MRDSQFFSTKYYMTLDDFIKRMHAEIGVSADVAESVYWKSQFVQSTNKTPNMYLLLKSPQYRAIGVAETNITQNELNKIFKAKKAAPSKHGGIKE